MVVSHAAAHWAPSHTGVEPVQAVLHEPQWPLSVLRSTQTAEAPEPQPLSPGPQQTPLLQLVPLPQTVPQPPQLLLSVSGSEHVPPQLF